MGSSGSQAHVHAQFHRTMKRSGSRASGSWVIVVTKKQKKLLKIMLSSLPRTVKI